MAPIILITIGIALLYDFLNGMNDAANSISTIVATRVLSPGKAVIWAAFFNFAAIWLFGQEIASTMSKGVIDKSIIDGDNYFIFCSLTGAILWVYICTSFGLPISVSHALIGGLIGPALAKSGGDALIWFADDQKGLGFIILFIFLAPIIGMVIGYTLQVITYWVFRRAKPHRVDGLFRVLQLTSSAAFSLGHGGNDAQKTAGVIILLLASTGQANIEDPPMWVFYLCYTIISLGTLIGGWKVVRTMGSNLTSLNPMGGFCAETAGAVTLFATAGLGIPASTTHTIAGAIMGVGASRRFSAVHWNVVYKIAGAWVFTIPATSIVSGLLYWGISSFIN
ncbi:MAG: inorganic phosphate transporter [Bacteroidetes bacterium]|nr:inorganic phosphate transporter [Bacteroidota bacterium]MBP7397942.1 inorganic phosphate transporter [Chitinophagales bacterium]MBK7108901.1 inorganic phosphate transporter [Bacteroidota bacterium]MBK8488774.1 inorganic phosphate transporter [Bacteroidota bacterium]MBK8681469.1 inorganic phosphate transporter [Bacteroidota bacterium]